MTAKNASILNFLLVVLLWNAGPAHAEEHHYSCPDMSQHEKILNEGQQVEKQYPRGRGAWASDRMHGANLMHRVSDYIPRTDEGWMLRQLQGMESTIFSMPLVSYDKKVAVISYAKQYEEYGHYATAKKLYERILAGDKVVQESEDTSTQTRSARQGLERVQSSDSALNLIKEGKYSDGIEAFGKSVETIYDDELDIRSKSNLLRPVLKDIQKAIEEQGKSSALSAADVINSQKVKARAVDVATQWKKELECLDMAEKLNRTAWNLEQHGEYKIAEKLYRQSLSIKEKNLGSNDPDTVSQAVNLARLYAAQGKKREACKCYDVALNALRKLPNPGSEFATMLENYGDMLDQMHEPERAEKIYAEARAYHERVRASK